ncbi:MAG TPA: PRC-barrel domain-containing protein [Rubrobacter sp.]|nr:PRC-barrel domain-containing protein [Rubrobacter sp.]
MFTIGPAAGTQTINSRRYIEEENVASEDRLRELEEKYENYKVYDNQGQKIGKVDDLFVDETDREEYIGVKMGFLGMKSTLIPMEIVRVNESDRSIEVSDSKDHVKEAPSFDDDEDITSEYEDRIRSHFGLESLGTSGSGYGAYGDAPTDRTSEESRDYDERSSASSETRERTEATTEDRDLPEYSGSREPSDDEHTGSREYSDNGDSGVTSEGGTATAGSSDEAAREVPTSRQTEETETFQEGGRTKVRRRVVREEIIEEGDDPNARS